MRAVVVRTYGGPEALDVVDVATPEPTAGEIRIKVAASAVNPVDLATRSGYLTEVGMVPRREVLGLGWDVAGTIDALGTAVIGFSPGQQVIGLLTQMDVPTGTHAEYVVLDAAGVAKAPEGVPLTAAATLPLNGLTAAQALDELSLRGGETALVTGAAGGVGGFAVQLAVVRGLRVVALAGDQDQELVRDLGAELFVARSADLASTVRSLVPGGVDGVVDAAVVGAAAHDALRDGGSYVGVIPSTQPEATRGTTVSARWVRPDGAQLAELADLASAGKLTLRVAETYRLEEAAEAHARLAKGGVRGRLVLTP